MRRLRRTTRSSGAFAKHVFINCPFDADYLPLLRPLLFTVVSFGFTPRIATERSDSAESRIDKICGLIRESRFSIHDLSRLTPGGQNFARMNMPFELGIDYGAREFGRSPLTEKRCLIVGTEQYDYQKALSDLSGVDIKAHRDEPETVVRVVRDWFFETGDVRPAPSSKQIWFSFADFTSALYTAGQEEGFSSEDLDRMPVAEFIDHAQEWQSSRRRRGAQHRSGSSPRRRR